MSEIRIKYNSSTVHIDGLNIRSKGSEFDYAQNACSALTRSYNFCTVKGKYATAGEALKAAKPMARALSKRLCKSCEAAALAMVDEKTEEPAGQTFQFLADLTTGETVRVEASAATRAEAKRLARHKVPGTVAVTSFRL